MPLGIFRLIRVSFDTKLSAILIFRGIHFGHTAEVNFAVAIVYEKTMVSAFSATSAEFTWPLKGRTEQRTVEIHDRQPSVLRGRYIDASYVLLSLVTKMYSDIPNVRANAIEEIDH